LQPAVKATSQLNLKAIYSRSLKSAKALNVSVDLYSDDAGAGKTYHDLLLRSDIDAVIIALPITSQPEYIEAALAAGKHVLSEKPIAADLKRAEHLIKYYKSDKVKNKATWGVGENIRFFESYQYASQEIAKLGRILGFTVTVWGNVKTDNRYYSTFSSLAYGHD
jgi:predicted dehydrogenase